MIIIFYNHRLVSLCDTYEIFLTWTPHWTSTRKDVTLTSQVLGYKDSPLIAQLAEVSCSEVRKCS